VGIEVATYYTGPISAASFFTRTKESSAGSSDVFPNSDSRWCVSDPLPPSAALPLTEGENKVISPSWGGRLHTISNQSWALQPCATRSPDNPSALIFRIYSLTGNCINQEN
jgi:hypothetical protein